MNKKNPMDFPIEEKIGNVASVDTSTIWAEVLDEETASQLAVGSLIAIQGGIQSEYLIGILERITRDVRETAPTIDDDGNFDYNVAFTSRDLVRVSLVGTYRTVDGTKTSTYSRGVDRYPRIESACWMVQGANLQTLMSSISDEIDEADQLLVGTYKIDGTAHAVADGNRLFQRHAAILGSTGSGKSWAVASILEQASKLNYPNLILLDLHGEYTPLSAGQGGYASGLRIAGPSDSSSDKEHLLYLPYWLLTQDEMQSLLLDRSEQNAPNQAARLAHHVFALKKEELLSLGKTELEQRVTVDSPVYFDIEELLQRLEQDDKERVDGVRGDKAGPFNGKLGRMIGRMKSKMADRRYAFLFDPPDECGDYEWLHRFAANILVSNADHSGIKILDLSQVPIDVLPLVTGLLARLIFDIQYWADEENRSPVTLVCDEAHLYLPARPDDVGAGRALPSFKRIAKEGRKYGLSILVVGQRPSEIDVTILSQCNNFIALRLSNDRDQSVVRNLLPENVSAVSRVLPLLNVGECIVVGDSVVLPTKIMMRAPEVAPSSASRKFWTDWNTKSLPAAAIAKGIENMRMQKK